MIIATALLNNKSTEFSVFMDIFHYYPPATIRMILQTGGKKANSHRCLSKPNKARVSIYPFNEKMETIGISFFFFFSLEHTLNGIRIQLNSPIESTPIKNAPFDCLA